MVHLVLNNNHSFTPVIN